MWPVETRINFPWQSATTTTKTTLFELYTLCLFFISICNHSFNSMDVSAEAPHFHLLTLAGFYCQWVRVNPFPHRNLCGFGSVCQNIENCRLVDDWKIRHHWDYLLKDRSNFWLNLRFWLWLSTNCNWSRHWQLGRMIHYLCSDVSGGGSTNMISNTQRSRGMRVSLEIIARTSWFTEPVRIHSVKRNASTIVARSEMITYYEPGIVFCLKEGSVNEWDEIFMKEYLSK